MKNMKYTEEQIAFALKQAETGTPVQEVIRKMGISEQTFCEEGLNLRAKKNRGLFIACSASYSVYSA